MESIACEKSDAFIRLDMLLLGLIEEKAEMQLMFFQKDTVADNFEARQLVQEVSQLWLVSNQWTAILQSLLSFPTPYTRT